MKISKVEHCKISKEDFEEAILEGEINSVMFEDDNCGGSVMYLLEVEL